MHRVTLSGLTFLIAVSFVSSASAHYLWVTIDAKKGEHGTVHVIFEHSAKPGDGKYLDPFVERGTTWIRTAASGKATPLKLEETTGKNTRWLSGPLTASGGRSIDSYGKWGVYRYGKTDVLLHYYARYIDTKSADDLNKVGAATQMNLDLSVAQQGGQVDLTAVWQGKPVGSQSITVFGPKKFKKTLKTDEEGVASFTPEAAGRYTFSATFEEARGGTDGGKEYQEIRHNFRMLANLTVE